MWTLWQKQYVGHGQELYPPQKEQIISSLKGGIGALEMETERAKPQKIHRMIGIAGPKWKKLPCILCMRPIIPYHPPPLFNGQLYTKATHDMGRATHR